MNKKFFEPEEKYRERIEQSRLEQLDFERWIAAEEKIAIKKGEIEDVNTFKS